MGRLTCVVCFSELQPDTDKITCSEECEQIHNMNCLIQQLKNEKRMKRCPNMALISCTCEECKFTFETLSVTQIVCQNHECRRRAQNKRQVRLNSNARKAVKAEDAIHLKKEWCVCKCPHCEHDHDVWMIPTGIKERVFCPDCQKIIPSKARCTFVQTDNRCYAV